MNRYPVYRAVVVKRTGRLFARLENGGELWALAEKELPLRVGEGDVVRVTVPNSQDQFCKFVGFAQ